jgi:hypothetical protein
VQPCFIATTTSNANESIEIAKDCSPFVNQIHQNNQTIFENMETNKTTGSSNAIMKTCNQDITDALTDDSNSWFTCSEGSISSMHCGNFNMNELYDGVKDVTTTLFSNGICSVNDDTFDEFFDFSDVTTPNEQVQIETSLSSGFNSGTTYGYDEYKQRQNDTFVGMRSTSNDSETFDALLSFTERNFFRANQEDCAHCTDVEIATSMRTINE